MAVTTWPMYLALIGAHIGGAMGYLSVSLQLITAATSIVYIGSIRSLRSGGEPVQTMTEKQAKTFPLTAGAVLAVLFVAFKLFHKDYINLLLGTYFFFMGTFAIAELISSHLEEWMESYTKGGINVPYLGEVTAVDGISLAVGMAISGWYAATGHWMGNNFIAAAICIYGIEQMSVGSFRIGAMLLVRDTPRLKDFKAIVTIVLFFTYTMVVMQVGLFFYDIIAVFYTPMMVSVAKSVTGPIKMLFLKTAGEKPEYSMLGLGDIALPGVFVALLVRYDFCISNGEHNEKGWPKAAFPKPMFLATLVGYVLGLVATLVVMHVYNHAQPALLYLVPAVLISSLVTAAARGEIGDLMGYEEGEPEESNEQDDKPADKQANESSPPTEQPTGMNNTDGASTTNKEPSSAGTNKTDGASTTNEEPSSDGTRQRRRNRRRE